MRRRFNLSIDEKILNTGVEDAGDHGFSSFSAYIAFLVVKEHKEQNVFTEKK